MNLKPLAALLCITSISFSALSASDSTAQLVNKAKSENRTQASHNVVREADFKKIEQELKAIKAQLEAKRTSIQGATDVLTQTFSDNENKLARLEEKLRLETGSLGELFGVVRQNAKELGAELSSTVNSVDRAEHTATVDQIIDAKSLPSMPQLSGLWMSMVEQIQASSELSKSQIAFINGEGNTQTVDAYRLGSIGLVTDQGYVSWNTQREDAIAYLKQPSNGPTLASLSTLANGDVSNVVVDPSRGFMLEQLALTPSLTDRLQAGGVVGKVILGLLAIGLIIALVRGISLAIAHQKIRTQLKNPEQAGDNPLGRVLAVYNKEQNQTVEALELRLLEAVVDEQTHLEKGLSMLKLLAALAPMLGLLGTVTGMIETFQVITQFGNGDPKVMAGGISMALVTTVLGLVAAMPLLLAHNILSTQAENIRNILEKQGIGLVAEQAEKTVESKAVVSPVGTAA
ncbi:MotA/TolQ/ExbB proton channel family protein [Vibrio crassostreae]|uniref:MotA/TolQ/ExbB proton channel family protein n=1 Tax=Vibrio crassostreae TaxID=246167 RepID=UPI000F496779|nr:MotA/TolQ/ExbB proton channel family protein [Vibrio crassostreae]ROP11090.1 outer membrane transport energization protein ExbB [Vibrio crassostreae]ROP15339.1 outer membrane transport energization protein ExbB [Vibrio crassostreae]RPE88882.1 outer membrane transport energization protein ExbB [Vibrio crassostreae]TCN62951.1 outer membrane transport energization protein ExbB [Vibrio crassostreae]TCV13719.1 outer membrane transport energization protein ExbB [Vibrio crassostreae]